MKTNVELWWVVLWIGGLSWGAPACDAANAGSPLVAHDRFVGAPPAPASEVVPPLVVGPARVGVEINSAPDTGASPIANASVDRRILVITANGGSAALGAIQNTLQYLGTPFDQLDASVGPALTDDMLASGTHGRYDAIFLDVGDLSVGGRSAFTDDEWTTLTTYEVEFGVRRVSLYTLPSASYGLAGNGAGVDPSQAPIAAGCTPAGAAVFVGTNCANPIQIDQGYAYPSVPTDGATVPLLADAAGNVYAATRTYPDGRQALALTFGQASSYVSYLELGYGLVSWATRGLFIGERHVYAVPQIDDLFLASAIYTGGIYRITAPDMQALAAWQSATRARPLTAGFRFAWAVNGKGSYSRPGDPLTAQAVALGSTFSWINHSWDHPILDGMSYVDALSEFMRNDQYLRGLGLMPYATVNAVTPNITGLYSADAMHAIHDAGIRQIVSDTSIQGEKNPSPNAGIWNALQPSVLEIPRIPTDLYFSVSQPSEWIPEYEVRRALKSIDYPTLIGTQSDALFRYMLNGNSDPWMFHQANTRNYDGAGHSLLTDLLDAAFAKYAAVMTFPIVSPTMDDLASRMTNRMARDASGVVATLQNASLTVTVTNAATVPVTGLCAPGAESYGGQTISYLTLSAGQSATYALGDDCDAGGPSSAGGGDGGGAAGDASGSAGIPDAAAVGHGAGDVPATTLGTSPGGCACSAGAGNPAPATLLFILLLLRRVAGRRRGGLAADRGRMSEGLRAAEGGLGPAAITG